jgi:hypothetical protein
MRRGFWIALLALGTVIGFGWGFARLCGYGHFGYGHGYHGHGRDGHFGPGGRLEERAADACVRAAERVLAERRTAPPPASAAPTSPPL